MMTLEILLDIVLFSILASGMWWTGTRSVTTDEGAPHERASKAETEFECDDCGGPVSQIDGYPHDGMTVEIYRCAACTREGTLVRHPDGHTSGRGILSEQADETILTLADYVRGGRKGLSRSFGRLKRLSGGLKRLSQRVVSDGEEHEKPCARALRCDHEETTTKPVTIDGAEYAETTCTHCGALLDTVPASEGDVFLAGDRFECQDGSTWEIVDPWIPVETGGTMVGTVRLERMGTDGGEYWVGNPTFETLVSDGAFSPLDGDTEATAPEGVAADGGTPAGTDDLGQVVNRLQRYHNSALVQVYDDRSEHLAYWDTSTDTVDPTALAYLQDQGFRVVETGSKHCEVTDQEQAWLEVRRHDPGEDDATRGDRR
jgi:hypothetical protein